MDLRIDEKGKYFTQRVTKDTLLAVIRTADRTIVGNIYVRPDRRIKDELDEDRSRFLAITDAHVYSADGEVHIYDTRFLLVSYHQIVLISPLDGITPVQSLPWYRPDAPEDLA